MNERESAPVLARRAGTPFGPLTILWSIHKERPTVFRIVLAGPARSDQQIAGALSRGPKASSCAEISKLVDRLEAYFEGEDVRLPLDIIRLDLCSGFQQRVLRAEYAVPRGRVTTYQLLAKHMGSPRAARAVGTALATNPFPIVIPCHRAIRSDGTLGGYQGGLKMKRSLLEMEGVRFCDAGRVETDGYFYGTGHSP